MKAKTEHTSGPWILDGIWGLIKGPKGEEIAAIHPGTCDGARQKPAVALCNARLIAAAPDMLAALEKIYNDPYTTCCCSEIAKAAIAKAKGTK